MNAFLLSLVPLLLWIGVFHVPMLIVMWRMNVAKEAYKAEAEEPFTDLPLRLPGESTRKAAEEHFEKAVEWALLLAAASALAGFGVAMTSATSRPIVAMVFGVAVVALAAVAGPRLLKALKTYWSYQLGFKGERVVAEELNQLLSQGWRIFHDVPFEGYNVDHVAVSAVGVFAVETKTRRKSKDRATEHPAHVVVWDGRTFTWPSGTKNEFALDQAVRNAKSVAEFLTKSTGEPVGCQPVLTLPGWFIESTGRGQVIVASTKGLHKILPKCGNTSLSAARIQQLAFQLGQKCKPDQMR